MCLFIFVFCFITYKYFLTCCYCENATVTINDHTMTNWPILSFYFFYFTEMHIKLNMYDNQRIQLQYKA